MRGRRRRLLAGAALACIAAAGCGGDGGGSASGEGDGATTTAVGVAGPDGQAPAGGVIEVGARTDPPPTSDSEFERLGALCFDTDMSACDQLYGATPGGSIEEAYGWSCGGRVDTDAVQPSSCGRAITPAVPVPASITDPALRPPADTCFAGDMAACDALFRAGASDSLEEVYGATCAGRVIGARALCVDIFGSSIG